MINIALGSAFSLTNSQNFVSDILATLLNSPTLSISNSTTATAIWSITGDDGSGGSITQDNIVTFHGTSLTSGGTISGMDFAIRQSGETFQLEVATGFNILAADMVTAVNSASSGNTAQLKALFEGLDWTLDASSATAEQSLSFQGTGGDDSVKLGAGNDTLFLDGGDDKVQLGAGDDQIFFDSALHYAGAGTAAINGGAGEDTLNVDPWIDTTQLTNGMKIDLNKAIKFDGFSIKLTSVEDVYGSRYTDTIIGTNGNNVINGNGGGDLIIGGGGSDRLRGGADVNDFFTYTSAADSKAGKGRDFVFDFEHGLDVFDLSKIDPGTRNHAFKFVGDNALKNVGDLHVIFHNEAGTQNDYYLVEANLDKDKAAEFQIQVTSLDHLTKSDFIL